MSFGLGIRFPGQASNASSRFDICRACEHAIEYPAGQLQCDVCKCWMNVKARLPNAQCPIGKW
jgi:hypothetical protein